MAYSYLRFGPADQPEWTHLGGELADPDPVAGRARADYGEADTQPDQEAVRRRPDTMTSPVDWDDEDLWDMLDANLSVRDHEPLLRVFMAYLLGKGWRPPEKKEF